MVDLLISQPYVPAYRVAFFEGLSDRLANEGVRLRVAAGTPNAAQALRNDAVSPPWLESVRTRELRIGGRRVDLTRTRARWRLVDLVIVPLRGGSVDAWSALFSRRVKVGLWGHVASYVARSNPLDRALEKYQMLHAQHVFSYTPSGSQYAREAGVSADRITTVMNTIDTNDLERRLCATTESQIAEFRRELGIPEGPFLAYIGGLDSSKRIAFLAEALDFIHSRGGRVHIVVGGAGAQASLLDTARSRGQVTTVGRVDGAAKALLLRGAIAIANPGRVGLVAVESLVARRPIVTTAWPFHAPEFDYLTSENSMISDDSVDAYADALLRKDEMMRLSAGPDIAWTYPRLEAMISNFASGVMRMMG